MMVCLQQSIVVALKLGRSQISQWKKKYQEHGLDGLKVRPLPGAVLKLTDQQTSQLRGWLVWCDPRQSQFDFPVVHPRIGGSTVAFEESTDDPGQGGKRLPMARMRSQRPAIARHQHNRGGSPTVEAGEFRKSETGTQEGAEVYFGDESGADLPPRRHHPGPGGADTGRGGDRERKLRQHHLRGFPWADSALRGVFSRSCNATVFVEFLKKLMHDAPGPVYLILAQRFLPQGSSL